MLLGSRPARPGGIATLTLGESKKARARSQIANGFADRPRQSPWAVKAVSRSERNDGDSADSGPSPSAAPAETLSVQPLIPRRRSAMSGLRRLQQAGMRRVEVWRGGVRLSMSVSAPFVWRCLSGSAVAPFPHPAHRTGQADFPHPALGQDLTPSFACDAIGSF